MERKSSPEPGTGTSSISLDTVNNSELQNDMAAVAIAPNLRGVGVGPQLGGAGVNKRYRPAPAKTFECRGYGDCRMVFSRSEHLARHIRKHTGERPFTCHCSKQFSRLDNLRQHAQTVHADKQDQNERMMRDLTTLHASMAAANKLSNTRRRASASHVNPPPQQQPSSENSPPEEHRTASPMDIVKQEDLTPITYDDTELYSQSQSWHTELDSSKFYQPSTLSFSTTGSRPTTSERLPPLSAIVSASIPPVQTQQQSQSQAYPSSFPAHLRPRPGTANRPSSSSSNSATSFYPNPPMNAPTTTSTKSFYPTPPALHYPRAYQTFDGPSDGTNSPPGQPAEASPFYFAPPEHRNGSSTSPPSNPRKRGFAAPDGPLHSYDELAAYSTPHQPSQAPHHHPTGLDYDYGSESRPQSRRLSVMELCNDGTEVFDGFLDRSAVGLAPPTIFERPVEQRRPSPAGSGSARSDEEQRQKGHGRLSPPSRRVSSPHINGNGIAPPPPPPASGANGLNGSILINGYAPPPRPHSTTFSVSSTSSAGNSPPHQQQHPQHPQGYTTSPHPSHQTFAYPTHPQQHQHQHQHPSHHQHHHHNGGGPSYNSLSLSMGIHHGGHPHHTYATSSPAPTSAYALTPTPQQSATSPRSALTVTAQGPASAAAASAYSPRSPGVGHMAQQQAQAYQALQAQQQGYGGHGHGHGGHGGHGHHGYGAGYEYGHGHGQGYPA